jgi:hypothetical protein
MGIQVNPGPDLVILTGSLPGAFAGIPYDQPIVATGGTGVGYTWSIVSGIQPPGLNVQGRDGPLNWGSFTISGELEASSEAAAHVAGMVSSRNQPGVHWIHDDTGVAPEFYAINAQGQVLQRYTLGTSAVDCQDIAIGPGPSGADYIYIGDFGDSGLTRQNCRVYRVEEPVVPPAAQTSITVPHQEFWFNYPGGAQDCATLLVDWETGTPYLVEKTSASPRVHKFPMPLDTAWDSGNPVVLTPVNATGTFDVSITGGDSARDSRRVVLRGYDTAREYARASGGSFDDIFTQTGVAISIVGGQQYEAISYCCAGVQLFTTTRLAGQPNAPIYRATAANSINTTAISGAPTSPGTYSFTVQVRDSSGNTATRAITVAVQ